MTLPRCSLAAVLVAFATFSALPARAQPVPAPGPDAPLPPSAQPLAPVQPEPPAVEPAPSVMPPYAPVWRGPPPAQVAWTPPDAEHTPPGNWYGWQTLIAVAPVDIAMFVGLAHFSDPSGAQVFATAFAARNLVPAVVHFAHQRVGRGFASIGLQAASTGVGVATGFAFGLALQAQCPPLDPCRNNFRGIPPARATGPSPGRCWAPCSTWCSSPTARSRAGRRRASPRGR